MQQTSVVFCKKNN